MEERSIPKEGRDETVSFSGSHGEVDTEALADAVADPSKRWVWAWIWVRWCDV